MKNELREDLSSILGRRVRTYELVNALGISRSAYYLQRDENRLTSADNLLKFAAGLGINPVVLLLRYGFIDIHDVNEATANLTTTTPARRRTLTPRADAPPIF